MFNYLYKSENEFFNHHNKKHAKQISDARWHNDIVFYFQSLITPFSAGSFSRPHFNIHISNLTRDLMFIYSPVTAVSGLVYATEDSMLLRTLDFIKKMLRSLFLIAIGTSDIALQATILSLSFVTRSIATVAYMANYKFNVAPSEENILINDELDPLNNHLHNH